MSIAMIPVYEGNESFAYICFDEKDADTVSPQLALLSESGHQVMV